MGKMWRPAPLATPMVSLPLLTTSTSQPAPTRSPRPSPRRHPVSRIAPPTLLLINPARPIRHQLRPQLRLQIRPRLPPPQPAATTVLLLPPPRHRPVPVLPAPFVVATGPVA